MENKSTDCCDLTSTAELLHSNFMGGSDSRLVVCEAASSIELSSGSLTNTLHPEISETKDTLLLMLDSVRHAEVVRSFWIFANISCNIFKKYIRFGL